METLQENPVSKKKSNPSVWRSMSLFLVPLLLSNVLQSVGQLVGMVAVGRWLGVDALAAVSSFFPLFFFSFHLRSASVPAVPFLSGKPMGQKMRNG